MLSRNQRDSTIGTMAVTPFGNLHVSIMPGRSQMTPTIAGWHLRFTEISQQLLVVELPIELIHLWDLFLKLVLIALRQAPHHIKTLQTPFILCMNKLKNSIDALFFGRFYKATCIDNSNLPVRSFAVMDTMISVSFELLHQMFAVNEVL